MYAIFRILLLSTVFEAATWCICVKMWHFQKEYIAGMTATTPQNKQTNKNPPKQKNLPTTTKTKKKSKIKHLVIQVH